MSAKKLDVKKIGIKIAGYVGQCEFKYFDTNSLQTIIAEVKNITISKYLFITIDSLRLRIIQKPFEKYS
jgi:hypothetical protein